MDELLLIETVERYLKGEMTAQEKTFFEEEASDREQELIID